MGAYPLARSRAQAAILNRRCIPFGSLARSVHIFDNANYYLYLWSASIDININPNKPRILFFFYVIYVIHPRRCKPSSVGQSAGLGSIPAKTQKTENSNLHRFELHRPWSKGTKLLLQVIKAIIIIFQEYHFYYIRPIKVLSHGKKAPHWMQLKKVVNKCYSFRSFKHHLYSLWWIVTCHSPGSLKVWTN